MYTPMLHNAQVVPSPEKPSRTSSTRVTRARGGDVRANDPWVTRVVRAPADVDAQNRRRRNTRRFQRTRAARRPAGPVVRTRRERVTPAVVRGACALPNAPVSPEPLYPAGHAPRPAAGRVRTRRAVEGHPPLFVAHSSMSTHVSTVALVPGRAGSALEPDAGSGHVRAQHSRVARRVRAAVDIDARGKRIGSCRPTASRWTRYTPPTRRSPPSMMSGSHPPFL